MQPTVQPIRRSHCTRRRICLVVKTEADIFLMHIVLPRLQLSLRLNVDNHRCNAGALAGRLFGDGAVHAAVHAAVYAAVQRLESVSGPLTCYPVTHTRDTRVTVTTPQCGHVAGKKSVDPDQPSENTGSQGRYMYEHPPERHRSNLSLCWLGWSRSSQFIEVTSHLLDLPSRVLAWTSRGGSRLARSRRGALPWNARSCSPEWARR